ncbi:MAG: NAD(P)/FAD-dependent oxidoreductase [Gammaproteobacteria bacterium]|nr:NAD(P)/FAD-dependent oxidoreductase [Gammaproteobacteria bacterium]MDH5312024.1 NAD(P)/FAD-dependent oxidoreductase [Gammaproteobacteria bacterium]
MRTADAIVVGGGPGGSTCAWKLRHAGLDVLVLDKATFPRTKLCAGWVTPEALHDLELDPGDYPHSFMTFDALSLHWKFLGIAPRTRQHSIRRYEFDDFLLQRAGAEVVEHKVKSVREDGGYYVIDELFRCRYLVGAGGTACPVYRKLFHASKQRASRLQIATLEQELAYDWQDPTCHLWFLDDGLPGYSWYVPKANGYINIGLGGIADHLKAKGGHLRDHWRLLTAKLEQRGLVRCDDYQPGGYSYYLRGDVDNVRNGNAYLVGDAAGLATRDMGEGIGPAVASGLRAARSIVDGVEYSLAGIDEFSMLLGRSTAGERVRRWMLR